MKRNFLVVISCIMLISISTLAYGAEGPYVSLNLGPAFAYDTDISEPSLNTYPASVGFDLDAGFTLSTSIGYDANFFRYELELLYQKNDMDTYSASSAAGSASGSLSGDITSLALMFNGYFDIRSFSTVVPYFTAGAGFANVEISPVAINVPGYGAFSETGDDDNVFAYQVGIGVAYNVNETVTADFKYRYFATADPDFSTATAEFSSHNIHFGLRFAF